VLGEFEGYAYAACSRNLTWNEAKAACISVFNGQLAKARDYQEFEFLVGLGYVDEQDYWLGASDAQTEGTFVWADGAAVGPYRPWLPSEPGDADWEDCVAIDEESGETVQGWDARDCDDKRAYMCMGANPW
jgi:podocalyxin-like protein 2